MVNSAQHLNQVIDETKSRLLRRNQSSGPELWALLDEVTDPEIPVISIWELGILQDVSVNAGTVTVVITPTYSGCPAMIDISNQIKTVLNKANHTDIQIKTQLAPAWTTDWITTEGKTKLEEYGIAPPSDKNEINCPQCGSQNTTLISEFGSTACKALHRCESCLEPFDYFKCI